MRLRDVVTAVCRLAMGPVLVGVVIVTLCFMGNTPLRAAVAAVTEPGTTTVISDTAVKNLTTAVFHHPVDERWRDSLLESKEYSYARTQTPSSWSQFIEKLLGSSDDKTHGDGSIGLLWWLFGAVGIGAVIVVLVRNGLLMPFAMRRRALTQAGDHDEEQLQQHEVEDRIGQAEVASDYRLAIRYRYLAILVALEEQQRIKREPWRTNRDYVRDLHDMPYRSAFQEVVRTFDTIWYGEVVITQDDYRAMLQPFVDLLDTVRRSAP